MKLVSKNRQAYFDYQILEEFEVGLVLLGTEIKAIRTNRATISGSYIKPFMANGKAELWWVGSHFHVTSGDETRTKKVLMHSTEIRRILGKLASGNFTLVPLELYLKRGIAKLKIGLATRRKKHDKRAKIKEKDIEKNLRDRFRDK